MKYGKTNIAHGRCQQRAVRRRTRCGGGWRPSAVAVSRRRCCGGALVVHDCDPPNAEIASPEFIEGAWCGVTYRAFLDFVRGNDEIDYFTVDADYGCGVILKRPPRHGPRRLRDAIDRALTRATESELTSQWFAAGRDDKAAFDFFRSNRRRLLRLTKPARFLSKYRRS